MLGRPPLAITCFIHEIERTTSGGQEMMAARTGTVRDRLREERVVSVD